MTSFITNSVYARVCGHAAKPLAIFTFVLITVAAVSAQSEFFDNAFARASGPPPIGGGGWVVTAKVTMNAAGKEYLSARGKVTLQPDSTLGGDLPLSINNSAVADNTLKIYIRKSNPAVVVVTRLIAGKPMLGRSATLVSLKVDPNFNYLSGPIKWTDGDRVIRVDLETEFVKKAAGGSGGGNSGGTTQNAIGARYKVSGYMEITNPDDGVGDSTLEVFGGIFLSRYNNAGKKVGTYRLLVADRRDAIEGTRFKLEEPEFDVFDDESTPNFRIEGRLDDVDHTSGPDMIWQAPTSTFPFPKGNPKVFRRQLNGDDNDESGFVLIYVSRIKDLYTK